MKSAADSQTGPGASREDALSPDATLFEALSLFLAGGPSYLPVGDAGPARRYLGAATLLGALHAGLSGDTPVSRLNLDTSADSATAAGSAKTLIDALPLLLWMKDAEGRYLIVNRSFAEACGRSTSAEVIGRADDELWPAGRAALHAAADAEVLAGGEAMRAVDQVSGGASPVWLESVRAPLRGAEGGIVGTVGFAVDVSERIRLLAAAERSEKDLNFVLSAIGEGVWDRDLASGTVRHNRRWCELLGLGHAQLIHSVDDLLAMIHEADRPLYNAAVAACMAQHGAYICEYRMRRPDGRVLWVRDRGDVVEFDADGQPSRMMGSIADITEVKESQRHLEHMAYHDTLTQLPNRSLFYDRMQMAVAQAERNGTLAAIAYLDLDGFKAVNDSLGHAVGDRLLVVIARRLMASTRAGDTVARIGGDEFALIYNGLERSEECEQILQRLLASIGEPVTIDNRELTVTASVGVTLCPLDGSDPEHLLLHADEAMYLAKESGRNAFQLYDPGRDRRLRALRDAQHRVELALDGGELELHYQPKVDVLTNALTGVEALIRWKHPELGLRMPGEFLPAVKDSRFEIELGDWVLRTAVKQLDAWHREGLSTPMSVNIAARHLVHPEFVANLRRLLAAYPAVQPELLQLEVLETATLGDVKRVAGIMAACNELGVSFAIDDFGTGQGALSSLRRLPVRSIKIDRSFIHNMLEDEEDLATVQSVIGLGAAFHREVIAEGVETPGHRQALLRLGCRMIQGHGVARPMPAARMQRWMQEHRTQH